MSSASPTQALVVIDLPPSEHDAIFDSLSGDDDDALSQIPYESFEQRLPAGARAALEARLTDDGVLPSLYIPPELWEETETAAELRWEQMVQLQAQRNGNQFRQNSILQDELGKL